MTAKSIKEILSVEPKGILMPRFDTLGDLVLLEGFIEALQSTFPRAKITFFIRRPFADLAGVFPETVDWLVTDVDPHDQPPNAELCRNLLGSLGEQEWDLLLATAYNRTWAEDLLAARLAGSAKSLALGYWAPQSQRCRELFAQLGLSNDCPYEHVIPVDELGHEVQKYRTFWQLLAGESVPKEPRLYIGEDLREIANRILSSLGLKQKNFCLAFPAGIRRITIKAWPAERFAEILAWLETQYGLPALVAGHASESSKVDEVAALALEKGAHPKSWLGRDGEIPILTALLAAAKIYVGNDTGPMHMAAAVDTPVVAVFGGGHWPRFLPQGNTSIAVAGEMPCFGCGWDCIFGDAPCMELVTVGDVKKAADELLGTSYTSGPRIFRASIKLSHDSHSYIRKAFGIHREINQDRLARLDANVRQAELLKASEVDRDARLEEIKRLGQQLAASEADRAARLEEIERLGQQLAASEADRAARLAEMERLGQQLAASEQDRAACHVEIERLGNQIQDLQAQIEILQSVRNSFLVRSLIKSGLVKEKKGSE